MTKMKTNFIKMDLKRCIFSPNLYWGILGVFIILNISVLNVLQSTDSIVSIVSTAAGSMPFLIVFPFCSLAYSDCFCEDFINGYAQLQVIRGNLKRYTFSKLAFIFISSMVTFTAGLFLYILFMHIKYPWKGSIDSSYEVLSKNSLLLQNGHFILYYLIFSIQFGLLIGLLSLLGAFISLYITNRLLILSIPMIAYYFLMYYSRKIFEGIDSLNVVFIYNSMEWNIWNSGFLSFLWAVFITLILGFFLAAAIYRKLKRRITGE